jgi:hypothetical protein
VLDSAGYGNFTITKSISIVAPAGVHAGISVFAGNGVTVNAPSSKVTLSGLTISGQGGAEGIAFNAGEELTVERCDVSGMQSHGIVAQATSARLRVHDTRVSGSGLEGIAVYGTVSADIDGVRSHANALSGLSAVNGARVTVARSEFSQNETHGVEVYNVFGPPTTYLAIDSSTISGNAIFGVKAYSPVFGRIEMALTRSTVAGNAADGIVALALGNPVVVAVSDTTVMSNGGNGLWADGYLASIIASRNSVSRQAGYGIYVTGSAAFYSTGDNVVEANIGGASSGVISAATVR